MSNAIVGQSGGPTAVINSSLAGVYEAAKQRGAKHVYGMLHGVQGLLEEKYIDLSERLHSALDIELLKRTPSSYLGSCRYKLPALDADQASPPVLCLGAEDSRLRILSEAAAWPSAAP